MGLTRRTPVPLASPLPLPGLAHSRGVTICTWGFKAPLKRDVATKMRVVTKERERDSVRKGCEEGSLRGRAERGEEEAGPTLLLLLALQLPTRLVS